MRLFASASVQISTRFFTRGQEYSESPSMSNSFDTLTRLLTGLIKVKSFNGGASSMAMAMAMAMALPAAAVEEERGLRFEVGEAFYRSESAIGRDLGVLAAAAYKRQRGSLRALDAMSGCGIRALRYLVQANADFVWANDGFPGVRKVIQANFEAQGIFSSSKWTATSEDANKLLLGCYIRDEFYDLIDVDSFGGNSVFLGSALSALRRDGLVYVTSTDGFSCSKRPYNALASYGTFTRRLPYINEVGLRMLIGGVVREAATRNMTVSPLFSYYASHGPVFRVMLRMRRGKLNLADCYGFVAYCHGCGASQNVGWEQLGQVPCSCPAAESVPYEYSGPMWTGPLHSSSDLEQMCQIAKEFGWVAEPGWHRKDDKLKLKELMETMLEESNPDLPCGFIELKEIASKARLQGLKRDKMVSQLRKEGFSVSRSHIEPNALKTSATLHQCIEVARQVGRPY